MTIENIKDIKKDLINGYEFGFETENTDNDVYTIENVIIENDNVLYHITTYIKGQIFSNTSIISSKKDFLKMSIKDIVNNMNLINFYSYEI